MKRILLCLMAFSAIISSCTRDHGDMYDPEFVREYYESQWKKQFGEIDPNQTWNVAQGVQANLSIKEDALADYTFNIFTSNPLYDKDAKLMAKTKVTTDAEGYAETSIKFDAPNGLKYFYVMRVNKNGRRAIKAIQAGNGVLNASFGDVESQNGARAMVDGDLESTKMACPYTVEEVNNMIDTGQNFSALDEKVVFSDGVYVVTGTENLASRVDNVHNQNGTAKIVVADGGILNLDYTGTPAFAGIHIIVADGGILNILSGSYQFQNTVKIVVMQGGVVEDKKDFSSDVNDYTVQLEGATLYNAGNILNLKRLKSNNGMTFYNAESGIYTGREILLQQDVDVITNWGKMDLAKLGGNNGDNQQGTLNNGCLFRSEECIRVQFLNLNGNTALECKEIYFDHVSLRENSILRANHIAVGYRGSQWPMGSNTIASFLYKGNAESSALLSAKTISSSVYYQFNPYYDNNNFVIDKSVFVEADSFEGSAEVSINSAILKSGASISKVGESDFAIFPAYKGDDLERSDCTGHGNVPDDYVPPTPENGMEWIVACEDLGSIGDYDFNDIVFSVTYVPGGENDTVVVHALAAGGTIPANVYVNNELIGEIHGLFGFDDTSKMINTLAEDLEDGSIFQGMVKKIIAPNFSISTADMGKIRIDIINGDGNVKTAIAPTQGGAPQMICVPAPWKWPVEYTSIGAAYPKFGLWGAGYNTGIDWYSTDIATGSVFNLE